MELGGKTAGEQLTPRKRDILRRVIHRYVREVHPVSSQSLAQEVPVSAATVRTELSALEEQGYLKQRHTSGGRVPTDQAYRFLVEELIEELADSVSHQARVAQVYRQLGTEAEALLEGTLDLLTEMTGNVAWISVPTPSALAVRSLNFIEVDTRALLLVLVTNDGAMQSRLVSVEVPVEELALGRLAEVLNNYLRGRSILEVDFAELRRLFGERVNVPAGLIETLQEFFLGLAGSSERVNFGNALQLALQPEFATVESISSVISVLDDKDRFVRVLRQQLSDRQVQTIIGSENVEPGLHECSLVLSRYLIPDGVGTVGVLGPTRQLYERTLPWVRAIGEAVAQALKDVAQENLAR